MTYSISNTGKRPRDRGGHRFPPGKTVEVANLGARQLARIRACRDLTVTQASAPPPSDDPTPDEPARDGAGSSKAAWTEYAQAVGVEVAESDTRDDIIAKVDTAKSEA